MKTISADIDVYDIRALITRYGRLIEGIGDISENMGRLNYLHNKLTELYELNKGTTEDQGESAAPEMSNSILFEIELDDMTIQVEECGRVQRFDKSGTLITTGKCLVINRLPILIRKIEAAKPQF